MSDTELNTNEIEQFFNFGNSKQIAPEVPRPVVKIPVEIKPTYEMRQPAQAAPIITATKTEELESEGMKYVGEIPNHPTRKFYPERTFDKYVKKDARLEENDVEMLKAWANNITHFKRKLGLNSGSSNRITDNTIMRIILSEFCDKLAVAFKDPSYKEVASEEELRLIISKIIG